MNHWRAVRGSIILNHSRAVAAEGTARDHRPASQNLFTPMERGHE
jgi:hypothetical protein